MSFRRGQLSYFVTVAEEGQITRAARKLHIAQPALSQAIAHLESQLGVELLQRHARGVSLTEGGELFLAKAKAALRAEADVEATGRTLARIADGSIEMGFLSTPPMMFAAHLFDAFNDSYPEVTVAFRELQFPSGSTVKWLAAVDVGMCFAATPHADIEMQTLWREQRCVLLHCDHVLATRGAVTVADVVDEPFYGSHPSVDPVWAGFWTLDDHRGTPPRRLTDDQPVNSLELIAVLSSGRALRAFTTTTARALASFLPELVAVPLSDATPAECALAWRASEKSPFVTAFVQVARSIVESGAESPASSLVGASGTPPDAPARDS
jgi:DNA-binding transcriptional LysR family regulator